MRALALALLLALPAAARAQAPRCRPASPRSARSIVAVVLDYGTRAPIPGAAVTVTHRQTCSKAETRPGEPQCKPTHPHPPDTLALRCTTGPDGRATFDVPDHDYEVQVAGPAHVRYLAPGEMTRYERAIEDKERLQETTHAPNGAVLTVTTKLVPASLLESPNLITTPERAKEVARAKLVALGCNPDATLPAPPSPPRAGPVHGPRPRPGHLPPGRKAPINYWGQWRVDFEIAAVDVNAVTGAARAVICRVPCCQDPNMAPTASTPYSPFEALADAAAEPLDYVGTTIWPGIFQIPSCVYRNSRVVVVNIYCTTKEMTSGSIVVLHPQRGRVKLYAQDSAPISTLESYGQWKMQAEDPPPPGRISPPLATSMTLDQLVAYEQAYYNLHLPGCWVDRWTTQRHVTTGHGKCRRKTPAVEQAWATLSATFRDPPQTWHSLMREFRRLAPKHARPDPRGKDP